MTREVPLFDFMPYGAPELLQGSRPGLARALAIGSLVWLTLFAVLLSTGPWTSAPPPVAPIPYPGPEVLPNVHAFDPPPPPPVAPTPPRKPTIESGVIEPVADAPVLAMDPMSSGATSASTGSQPNAGTAAESGIAVSIPDEPATIVPWQADHDPALVRADKPVYPDLAVQAQVEGDVYLRLLVGVDGRVMEVTVLRGVPMLDGAAVSAARTWVFTPAVFNGRPARVLVDVPVKFRLH